MLKVLVNMNNKVWFQLWDDNQIFDASLRKINDILKLRIKKNMYIDVFTYEKDEELITFYISFDDFIGFYKYFLDIQFKNYEYGIMDDDLLLKSSSEWNRHVNIREESWKKFIYHVIEQNRIDVLNYLIDNKFFEYKASAKHIFGNNVLKGLVIDTCGLGNDSIFMYLFERLKKMVDNVSDLGVEFMLICACEYGNFPNAAIILNNYKNHISHLTDYLINAVESGNLDIVKLLIECGARIEPRLDKLLRISLLNNFIDIVNFLLSKGANINKITEENIEDCVVSNHLDSIELLFGQREFDQNEIDRMFICGRTCSAEMVELFVNNGANVKKYGKKLLRKAEKCENYALVKYLEKVIKK